MVSEQQKMQCHVHDRAENDIASIRVKICRELSLVNHTDGKYYCILHLPTKEKDIAMFEEVFQARLDEVKHQEHEIEKLSKGKYSEAKHSFSYDFRFVWFPSKVILTNHEFKVFADFSSVTFAEFVSLKFSKFEASANFRFATFEKTADFRTIVFNSESSFSGTVFMKDIYFRWTEFNASAYFNEAKFYASADFSSTTFISDANFRKSNFEDASQIVFKDTRFHGKIVLGFAKFGGYFAFIGTEENRLFEQKSNLINLQDARIDSAKGISFHSVRVEPSWFINTDATKFNFYRLPLAIFRWRAT